jgi:hypothetical protein
MLDHHVNNPARHFFNLEEAGRSQAPELVALALVAFMGGCKVF